MESPGNFAYDAPVVVVSELITVSAANGRALTHHAPERRLAEGLSAAVMGFAVAGMQDTGMAAVGFTDETHGAAMAHPSGIGLGQGTSPSTLRVRRS